MKADEKSVFYARNLSELFYHIKTISTLKIVGGCTNLCTMPEKTVSTLLIPELRTIEKYERYIEFGPGTTLSEIEELGERHLPPMLYQAVSSIANAFVRNLATVGGNILADGPKHTLYAPLLALGAVLEIRSPTETKNIPLHGFTAVPPKHALTNIRVPLNSWDVSIFHRLGTNGMLGDDSASFAFLVDTEKGVITKLRIALGGMVTFRCAELENKLLGTRLPLHESNIEIYISEAAASFDAHAQGKPPHSLLRRRFINLVRSAFDQLT